MVIHYKIQYILPDIINEEKVIKFNKLVESSFKRLPFLIHSISNCVIPSIISDTSYFDLIKCKLDIVKLHKYFIIMKNKISDENSNCKDLPYCIVMKSSKLLPI